MFTKRYKINWGRRLKERTNLRGFKYKAIFSSSAVHRNRMWCLNKSPPMVVGARIRSGEYRVNPLFIIIELFGSVILSNNIASLALSFFCILLLAGWVHRRRKRMMTGWSHLMWYSITFNGIQLEYAEIETEECGCLWGWMRAHGCWGRTEVVRLLTEEEEEIASVAISNKMRL